MRLFLKFFCISLLFKYSFLIGQDPARFITIKNVIYDGNEKTRERIISRELSFQVGDSLQLNKFDSLFTWNRIRIYNTNLFNEVGLFLEDLSYTEAVVRIKMEERWYLYPSPIFRLIDRNFNDWWVNRNRDLSRVNYGIKINQFNFRGRREFVRLIVQTGFTNVLSLRYNIPYIDKKQQHGLLFDLSYFDAKNVAYTTIDNIPRFTSDGDQKLRKVYRHTFRHSYRRSFYSFHLTSFGYYNTSIADTLAQLNSNYLGGGQTSQRYFFIGHTFRYDKRNNINYATEGTSLRAGFFRHGLGLFNDEVSYWRIQLAGSKYWDLKNNFFLANDVSALSTFPAERDYFNYYQIGTLLEVLRGYDLNVVEGSSYVIQRNELKYKLIGKKWDISKAMPIRQFQTFPFTVYGKIYFDQGYARGYPEYDGSDLLSDRYLYSFGAGLDLVTVNDLTFRFEYSRNVLNQTFLFISSL